MGFSSIWHWLIVLLIVVLLFGTKRLGSMGKDLGSAIKGFKEGLNEAQDKPSTQIADNKSQENNSSSAKDHSNQDMR